MSDEADPQKLSDEELTNIHYDALFGGWPNYETKIICAIAELRALRQLIANVRDSLWTIRENHPCHVHEYAWKLHNEICEQYPAPPSEPGDVVGDPWQPDEGRPMSDADELRQARLKTAADFTDAEYAKMSAEFPGFFSSEVYQYVIDLRQQNAALLADLAAIRGKSNKLVAKTNYSPSPPSPELKP